MSKQQSYQKFILKIHSGILLKNNLDFNMPLDEMRNNNYIISLADSQVLRFIDEINCIDKKEAELKIKEIRGLIKKERSKAKKAVGNEIKEIKQKIKYYYSELDKIQFKADYITVIMDKANDIFTLDNGFKINGINYKRLVGTSNGVKKSTIVYVAEVNNNGIRIYDELYQRLENGRDTTKKFVPAKYEAYKSLACSASVAVTQPSGILVVDDLLVHFNTNIVLLDDALADSKNYIEPSIEYKNDEIEINASDGFGLILPSLAEKWSNDLKLNYLLSGCCIRNSFLKGMVYTFDFLEFARQYNVKTVKDVWGTERNVDDIDIILPVSMLKLWDSFKSLEEYLDNCNRHHYTFGVTKSCPEVLDEERSLNYQFIQSYELTDDEIYELIAPNVRELKEVLGGSGKDNVNKALLFLRGIGVTESSASCGDNDFIKALMIEPEMIKDPYVTDKINALIKKRIVETKIGVIKVTGNYSMVSGDPYAFCQHIFKTNVDENGNNIDSELGLLGAEEIYSKHWVDRNVDEVVCFRAPMSNHHSVIKTKIKYGEDIAFWYQYMKTVTIINCHDAMSCSLNGMDYDGDLIFTTNNPVLLKKHRKLPSIICTQHSAEKKVIEDKFLLESNKDGFGDAIGVTTNHITAMFDIQSLFEKDSKEYKALEYRIQAGQMYQQNCIDRIKGVRCKPMPNYWYSVDTKKDEDYKELREFNNRICAAKKPYFMVYIYPAQMQQYRKYITNVNKKCLRTLGITLDELKEKKVYSEAEEKFMYWYNKLNPVSDYGCVMNRLCHMIEREFDGYSGEIKAYSNFDYTILKSNVQYTEEQYKEIKKIHTAYQNELVNYMTKVHSEKTDSEDRTIFYNSIKRNYQQKCVETCPDPFVLCDILLDLCYQTNKNKQFVWDVCGDTMIKNLLKRNNGYIKYIEQCDDGNIEYRGMKFKKKRKQILKNIDNNNIDEIDDIEFGSKDFELGDFNIDDSDE